MGQMKLGLSMLGYGYHQTGWLHPESPKGAATDLKHYLDMTLTAQRGLFDMVFLADYVAFPMVDIPKGALGRRDKDALDPLTILAALSPLTSNIGLVATASTTFSQPYHVARSFASIDQISGGRAGWNVVTSFQEEEAKNFGSTTLLEKARRYHRAEEFVDVAFGLWNSFQDDTFVYDKVSGQYFHPDKVNVLNHAGEHFHVKGPLTVPRTPQGRPIIVQAGASEEGQQLAARTADVVYTVQSVLEDAQKFYKGLKGRMAQFGRQTDDMKIMPGLLPVVADTEENARKKFKEWQEMIDPLVGLEFLARVFGDLSAYSLDEPVPELRSDREITSRGKVQLAIARRNNYTIRQMLQSVAIGNAHNTVIGTPEQIADVMEAWFTQGAADGFNILPAITPVSVNEFVDHVVPILKKRGLMRTEYEATTLRGNLGLSEPR